MRLLRGFARVDPVTGKVKEVIISCPVDKLCYYNEKSETMEPEHMDYEVYMGTSSGSDDLLMGTTTL